MDARNQSNASAGVVDPMNEVEDALAQGATDPAPEDERIAVESEVPPRY